MANRYWVGGTATWDGTAGSKWSTTSGGGGGSAVPTAADDVFFDGSSGSGTCTTSGNRVCRSLDCNGYTGTLTQNAEITIGDGTAGAGNRALRLASGMTYTNAGDRVTFTSTSGTTQTIEVAGKTIFKLRFNGSGGSWQLTDAVTLSGAATFVFQKTTGTLDTNSQSITCTGNTVTFAGDGATFADVTFSGTGTHTITGTNTFSRLIATGSAKTFTLPGGVTTTFTGSTPFPTGTAGNVMTFVSSSGSATVSFSNSVSVDYVALTDIVASGTTPAYSGLHSTDGGGNTLWVFSLPPKVFTTAGSFSWRPADDGYPSGPIVVECCGGGGHGAASTGGGGGGGGGEYQTKTLSLTDTTTYTTASVSASGAGSSSSFYDGTETVEAYSGSDASGGTQGAGGTGGTGTTGYAGGAGGAGGGTMGDGGGGGGGAAGNGGVGSAGTASSGSGTHAGGANGTDTTGLAGDGGQGGGGTGGGSSAVGGNYGGGGGGGGMMGGASNGAGGCVRFSLPSGGDDTSIAAIMAAGDSGTPDITGLGDGTSAVTGQGW